MKQMNPCIGLCLPSLLLPADHVNLQTWSVVACDQYTSQPEYWEEVMERVGNLPSTLHLTLPEIYLEAENTNERICDINAAMTRYLEDGTLKEIPPCMVYVERTMHGGRIRKGLILAIDLEQYDYRRGATSLIRATEGTVEERLPPRMKVREHAALELPHILLLIDDPAHTVIGPLQTYKSQASRLYNTDLLMEGGHIEGYGITDEPTLQRISGALEALANPENFCKKYGLSSDAPVLLYAVGDGNHSLASAKGHWDNIKKSLSADEIHTHPARYALVELVNVHDEGLEFEPIHRVLFHVDAQQFLKEFQEFYVDGSCTIEAGTGLPLHCQSNSGYHVISYRHGKQTGMLQVKQPRYTLEVATLQAFIDQYLQSHPQVRVDYIHGQEVVTTLASQPDCLGFYLPAMNKHDLFRTVILEGALPRKTFSMGEAQDKRYYLEARRIR